MLMLMLFGEGTKLCAARRLAELCRVCTGCRRRATGSGSRRRVRSLASDGTRENWQVALQPRSVRACAPRRCLSEQGDSELSPVLKPAHRPWRPLFTGLGPRGRVLPLVPAGAAAPPPGSLSRCQPCVRVTPGTGAVRRLASLVPEHRQVGHRNRPQHVACARGGRPVLSPARSALTVRREQPGLPRSGADFVK